MAENSLHAHKAERQWVGEGHSAEPHDTIGWPGFPVSWRPGTRQGTFIGICAGEWYTATLEHNVTIGKADWFARRLGG